MRFRGAEARDTSREPAMLMPQARSISATVRRFIFSVRHFPAASVTRILRAAAPVSQTHSESEQGKDRGQSQGPQAGSSFKSRAQHAADRKADNHREGAHR